MRRRFPVASLALLLASLIAASAAADLAADALAAMKKATAYFTTEVACHGGYLWWYSADLKQRAGEGKATPTQIWIQPPGTPSVGLAFVRAYEATGDRQFLDAAVGAAKALVWGQLESGGWTYRVDFSPKGEKRSAYRHLKLQDIKGRRNTSTLDDNTTQHALRLLMAVDQLVKDPEIHDAVTYGLDALLKAQLPKGGWAQRFFLKPPAKQQFQKTVRINPDGSRDTLERPRSYGHYYTFNDNTINDCISVLVEAHKRYGEAKYLDAVKKCADFIILTQINAPQAGWAQQYTPDLKVEWARRFEPPAVCGAVTFRNIRTLIEVYIATGDEKCLKPIPAALDWLDRSRLPGKKPRWARFYELGTNRPLYFTKDKYELTYSSDNMPTHYSFISSSDLHGRGLARYNEVKAKGRDALLAERTRKPTRDELRAEAKSREPKVREIIAKLDAKGRWLSKSGKIECGWFNRNLQTLAAYVAAVKGAAK